MPEQPLVIVGFAPAALTSLAEFQPDRSVIVIEEPDVVRKRHVDAAIARSSVVRELIPWEYQLPGAADAFVNAHPTLRPAAVAPIQEYPTPFAARLAERYGLAGAGLGAALVLRDKAALRAVTSAAGIRNPESATVREPSEVRQFMAAHQGAVVLKPANRQASVGTLVIHDPADVDAAWAECLQQDEGVMVPDRPRQLHMLVERFVRGEEYSVEMLVDAGRPALTNITGKVLFPGPRPIEMAHVVPADLGDDLAAALREGTQRVVAAVGFGTGIIHCEWIVAGATCYLVECAGRFAGDGIIELIEWAYRVELVRAFWTLMKGERLPSPLPQRAEQAAAVWFLRVEPGEVQAVDGLDEAAGAPGVVSCHTDLKPGDRTRELRSSWDRAGSVIACGHDPSEALERAKSAIDRIHVKVRT